MSESWLARRPSLGSGLYSCEVRSARATLDFSQRKLQKAILSAAAEVGLSLRPVLEPLVEWGAHHAKELDEAHRLLPCDAVVRNRTARRPLTLAVQNVQALTHGQYGLINSPLFSLAADQQKRRITSKSRSQIGARFLVGAVATPSRSADSAPSGDAYQAESGDGNIPNVNASRATATSDVPFGNFNSTAKPGAAR